MTNDLTADELAVRELAARYSDAVNRGSAQDMAGVYVNDGALAAFGAPDVVGHSALLELFTKVVGDHQWIFQMTHSGIVRINGDQAECRWWVSENGMRKDGSGTVFLGSYQDVAVRTPEGWRFARRTLQPVYLGRTQFPGKTFSPGTFIEL